MIIVKYLIVLLDIPRPYIHTFQDSASAIMEGIIELHDHILFFLIIIINIIIVILIDSIWIFKKLKKLLKYKKINSKNYLNSFWLSRKLKHDDILELLWTALPSVVLVLIGIPSFILLYSMDEIVDPIITVKIIGHQWYWSYEYDLYQSYFLFLNTYITNNDYILRKPEFINWANSWVYIKYNVEELYRHPLYKYIEFNGNIDSAKYISKEIYLLKSKIHDYFKLQEYIDSIKDILEVTDFMDQSKLTEKYFTLNDAENFYNFLNFIKNFNSSQDFVNLKNKTLVTIFDTVFHFLDKVSPQKSPLLSIENFLKLKSQDPFLYRFRDGFCLSSNELLLKLMYENSNFSKILSFNEYMEIYVDSFNVLLNNKFNNIFDEKFFKNLFYFDILTDSIKNYITNKESIAFENTYFWKSFKFSFPKNLEFSKEDIGIIFNNIKIKTMFNTNMNYINIFDNKNNFNFFKNFNDSNNFAFKINNQIIFKQSLVPLYIEITNILNKWEIETNEFLKKFINIDTTNLPQIIADNYIMSIDILKKKENIIFTELYNTNFNLIKKINPNINIEDFNKSFIENIIAATYLFKPFFKNTMIFGDQSMEILKLKSALNSLNLFAKEFFPFFKNDIRNIGTLKFDSYLIADSNLNKGMFRLLEVEKNLILPSKSHIRLLITSDDVIHSWSVPALGLKVDALPGRLNQIPLFIKRSGVFYGQCSEICGVGHGYMPIKVIAIPFNEWLHTLYFNLPKNHPNTEIRITADYAKQISKNPLMSAYIDNICKEALKKK